MSARTAGEDSESDDELLEGSSSEEDVSRHHPHGSLHGVGAGTSAATQAPKPVAVAASAAAAEHGVAPGDKVTASSLKVEGVTAAGARPPSVDANTLPITAAIVEAVSASPVIKPGNTSGGKTAKKTDVEVVKEKSQQGMAAAHEALRGTEQAGGPVSEKGTHMPASSKKSPEGVPPVPRTHLLPAALQDQVERTSRLHEVVNKSFSKEYKRAERQLSETSSRVQGRVTENMRLAYNARRVAAHDLSQLNLTMALSARYLGSVRQLE